MSDEDRLKEVLLRGYQLAGEDVGYWAHRYLQSIRRNGAIPTVKRLLAQRGVSDGFLKLKAAGRLDLAVETVVLLDEFSHLFTATELSEARARLEDQGSSHKQIPVGLSRKQFVLSQGATCNNWTWSWSFVNHASKLVIFGAWKHLTENGAALILSDEWRTSPGGREQPGFTQATEHIRLIEKEGYRLMTFPMIIADDTPRKDRNGPAKIKEFIPELNRKILQKVGGDCYAADENTSVFIPEEVGKPESFLEGASKTISVNSYERNAAARAKCIAHYGFKCSVCAFDFGSDMGTSESTIFMSTIEYP